MTIKERFINETNANPFYDKKKQLSTPEYVRWLEKNLRVQEKRTQNIAPTSIDNFRKLVLNKMELIQRKEVMSWEDEVRFFAFREIVNEMEKFL